LQNGLSDVKNRWLADVAASAGDNMPCVLVANKCDLLDQREVATVDGKVRDEN